MEWNIKKRFVFLCHFRCVCVWMEEVFQLQCDWISLFEPQLAKIINSQHQTVCIVAAICSRLMADFVWCVYMYRMRSATETFTRPRHSTMMRAQCPYHLWFGAAWTAFSKRVHNARAANNNKNSNSGRSQQQYSLDYWARVEISQHLSMIFACSEVKTQNHRLLLVKRYGIS